MLDRRRHITHRLSPIDLKTLSREQVVNEYLNWDLDTDVLVGRDEFQIMAGTFEVDEYQERLLVRLEDIESERREIEARLCDEVSLRGRSTLLHRL
jgi:hypothetical protein